MRITGHPGRRLLGTLASVLIGLNLAVTPGFGAPNGTAPKGTAPASAGHSPSLASVTPSAAGASASATAATATTSSAAGTSPSATPTGVTASSAPSTWGSPAGSSEGATSVASAGEPASTQSPGGKLEPAIERPAGWGFTVAQSASQTPNVSFAHYGDLEARGTISPAPAEGSVVDVLRNGSVVAETSVQADGVFSAPIAAPATAGSYVYQALLPDSGFTSPEIAIVHTAPTITFTLPTSVDSVKAASLSIHVVPSLITPVRVQVMLNGGWINASLIKTDASGNVSVPFTYGSGTLGAQSVRTELLAPDQTLIPDTPQTITRVAMPDAVVRPTTAADVRYTYRTGCPVAPPRLSTITMNFIGYDKKVHTGGILIVRTTLASKVVGAFTTGMKGSFPIKEMLNPNAFKGSDTSMMNAGNTSAFNCRQVTGNPYAVSPHSYGIAIDVNTWENPYEDPSGHWYGNVKYAYYRPASVAGLLVVSSPLTVALRSSGATWLRPFDWQHFQYR